MRRVLASGLTVAIALSGCGPELGLGHVSAPAPSRSGWLEVWPEFVDLGVVGWGEVSDAALTLTNAGSQVVDVVDLRLLGDVRGLSWLDAPSLPFEVAAGEAVTVGLRFTPEVSGTASAVVVIGVDGSRGDELRVPVRARGKAPALQVSPAEVDLGEHPVGCTASARVRVQNVGDAPTTLSDVRVVDDAELVAVMVPTPPEVLDPGQARDVSVLLEARSPGAHAGRLVVAADLPGGAVELPVRADVRPHPIFEARFEVPVVEREVDLVLAVDRSSSMLSNDDPAVEKVVAALIDRLEALGTGWHLAVVTGTADRCFVDGWMDAEAPGWQAALRAQALSVPDPYGTPTLGLGGLTSALLEAVVHAAWQDGPRECAEGFRRPGAAFHVLAVSDSDDKSWFTLSPEGPASPRALVESTVSEVLTPLEGIAVAPELLRVHVVVPDRWWRWCASGPQALRFLDAANATGGAVVDLCAPGLQVDLPDLVESVWPPPRAFPLPPGERPPTEVAVEVDGIPAPDGWHLDPAQRAVVFDEPPAAPTTVTVSYTERLPCEPARPATPP